MTKPSKDPQQKLIDALFGAYRKLRDEHGWIEPLYCRTPPNVRISIIEAGSTGIHVGYHDSTGFWIADGDTWPSNPILWRPIPPPVRERSR